MTRTHVLPAAALAAVFALAGCGGGDHDMSTMSPAAGASTTAASSAPGSAGSGSPTGSAPASTAGFNDADTAFLTGMIPHHRQAVEMAKLAAKAGDPKVKALAVTIEAAQGPEITTMAGLLQAAGKPVPDEGASMGDHAGMGHSTGEMTGMASEEEMTRLEGTTGPEFDRMFLTLMTRHHEGAVQMARTQQASGQHPDVKALATTIAADQTREIAEMARLLEG